MPELPDLTVFANNLTSKVVGKEIKSVDYYGAKRLNVTPGELQKSICNTAIQEVNRSGKEIEFVFSNNRILLVHLMLSGGFSLLKDVQNVKYKIVTLAFSDGNSLVITDPNGLVTLNMDPVPSKVPDALDIKRDYLKGKILEKHKMVIKAFLIDQKILRGIGNAYADEILWKAKISPRSIVGKLTDKAIDDLLNAITEVLLDAIKQINRIKPGIISGEVREFLSVHNSYRQKSPTGHLIIKEQVATKTTYYTDEQIIYI
jgi:formamidopyrimidine-DNA glycosylase